MSTDERGHVMQESRYDGTTVLSTAKLNEINKAIGDEGNRSVTLHKPGEIVTLNGGAQYRVAKDGSWRRIK